MHQSSSCHQELGRLAPVSIDRRGEVSCPCGNTNGVSKDSNIYIKIKVKHAPVAIKMEPARTQVSTNISR